MAGYSATVSEGELRWALANEGLEALFQPIVRADTGAVVAVEALARLYHPDHGTIQPDDFVPQMEGAGLGLNLADRVTVHALRAVPPGFLAAHHLSVAVNLPLDVLLQPSALDRIDAVRARFGVPSHCLTIELTESQPVTDVAQLQRAIERWRGGGYALALDDVGPEMPRHRKLLDLPFSTIKLDKNAVQHWMAEPESRFVPATIRAAHARGLAIVAEGIEDEAAWDRIADLGADHLQGFLIARPLTASSLPDWLRAWPGRTPRDQKPDSTSSTARP